jgi:uncharacterized repeat protein (TIGR03803 family)
MDAAGNLYGATEDSADNAGSVIWELNTAGKEIILYSLPRSVAVIGGVTIDSAGNLYGATLNGGTGNAGTVVHPPKLDTRGRV